MKIKVGDGTTRTFHAVMATWYNEETPKNKKSNESEDDENFGEDGYSSERARSRYSLAWQRGALRDEAMGGGRKDESDEEDDNDSVIKKSPPLFVVTDVENKGDERATDNVGKSGDKQACC